MKWQDSLEDDIRPIGRLAQWWNRLLCLIRVRKPDPILWRSNIGWKKSLPVNNIALPEDNNDNH